MRGQQNQTTTSATRPRLAAVGLAGLAGAILAGGGVGWWSHGVLQEANARSSSAPTLTQEEIIAARSTAMSAMSELARVEAELDKTNAELATAQRTVQSTSSELAGARVEAQAARAELAALRATTPAPDSHVLNEAEPPAERIDADQRVWTVRLYFEDQLGSSSAVSKMGVMELGMDARGLAAIAQCVAQTQETTSVVKSAFAVERARCLRKAFIAKSRGVAPMIYESMLAAFEKQEFREFNRLANVVNAGDLLVNASELGMGKSRLRALGALMDEITKRPDAASQREPMEKMQAIVDTFVSHPPTAEEEFQETVRESRAAKTLRLAAGKGSLGQAAFSRDGTHVILCTGRYEGAQLWDADTGKLLRTFAGPDNAPGVSVASFSVDGTLVVTGMDDEPTTRLWDAGSGKEIRSFDGPDRGSWAVAISPNNSLVAALDGDGKWWLWDAATGEEVHRVEVSATRGSFSCDGKRFVIGRYTDGTPGLLDVATGAELGRFQDGHERGVEAVALSPDGQFIVTSSLDEPPRIWDVATWKECRRLGQEPLRTTAVAFSTDGGRVATGDSGGRALVWEVATGRKVQVFEASASLIALTFAGGGSALITVAYDRVLQRWKLAPQ